MLGAGASATDRRLIVGPVGGGPVDAVREGAGGPGAVRPQGPHGRRWASGPAQVMPMPLPPTAATRPATWVPWPFGSSGSSSQIDQVDAGQQVVDGVGVVEVDAGVHDRDDRTPPWLRVHAAGEVERPRAYCSLRRGSAAADHAAAPAVPSRGRW